MTWLEIKTQMKLGKSLLFPNYQKVDR